MKKDDRFKMLILLAICCAVCGIFMIIKRSYIIAAFDVFACTMDLYAAWIHYKS